MASLYSTKATASGGRHGSIRSEDGLLNLKLALPRALGGRGGATNPEQLFAGGVVHQSFVTRRLSPGGSADLLAMTLFIHACEAEFLSCRM
jgi:hypothetical protein